MKRKNSETLVHPFPAVYDAESKILILGSFPSVKSREVNFYYGHPQNRFWKVMGQIFDENIGSSTEEKEDFCHKHRIALWDVIYSCRITGSSDASITDVKVNDFNDLLKKTKIRHIFLNGKTAGRLFEKYGDCDMAYSILSSTSPANAVKHLEDLVEEYGKIKEVLDEEN